MTPGINGGKAGVFQPKGIITREEEEEEEVAFWEMEKEERKRNESKTMHGFLPLQQEKKLHLCVQWNTGIEVEYVVKWVVTRWKLTRAEFVWWWRWIKKVFCQSNPYCCGKKKAAASSFFYLYKKRQRERDENTHSHSLASSIYLRKRRRRPASAAPPSSLLSSSWTSLLPGGLITDKGSWKIRRRRWRAEEE